jgi:hypothetical protein
MELDPVERRQQGIDCLAAEVRVLEDRGEAQVEGAGEQS